MKILIIGPGKLKYMPYAHFYLDSIDCVKNDVHFAYWNRDEKDEDLNSYHEITLHEFKCFIVNNAPLMEKFYKFYRFRRFCKHIIEHNRFDFIIVLHSLSGLMIYDILKKKYIGKFILDYRDSTYERNKYFRHAVGMLNKWSKVSFISSDGFREFLPESELDKTITSHNLLEEDLRHRCYKKNKSDKIRLAFWGFIRHIDINKYLIDRISEDPRFELHYYGREQRDALALKEYVREKGCSNIFFHGEYKPEERYSFVLSTDIIHNIYFDTNALHAMGNKYYDGIIFRIPQVCFPGSQMSKMSETSQVGISLDPRDLDFCDSLYDYYIGIDPISFNASCDNELNRVLKEYYLGQEIIQNIFNNYEPVK